MYSFKEMQSQLLSMFDSDERCQIEAIRNNIETLGRHPIVILLYSNFDDRFASQQLANLMTGFDAIRRSVPKWSLSKADKLRLVDPNVDTSNSMLGELLAYAYLIDAFPNTAPIPTCSSKTPDFEVKHYLNKPCKSVFVEVHTKAWSNEMQSKMKKTELDLHSGKIGGTGPIRMVETVIAPFSGLKQDSHTEDGVSKLAQVGSKCCQFPKDSVGILWFNFEQADFDMVLTPNDCLPLHSRGSGATSSGIIWHALYGQKGMPLYEMYPDKSVMSMKHDGLFAQHPAVSAVAVNFGRHIMLFENPETLNAVPEWFREQIFNVKWFSCQYSRLQFPGVNLRQLIDVELSLCNALNSINTFANW